MIFGTSKSYSRFHTISDASFRDDKPVDRQNSPSLIDARSTNLKVASKPDDCIGSRL